MMFAATMHPIVRFVLQFYPAILECFAHFRMVGSPGYAPFNNSSNYGTDCCSSLFAIQAAVRRTLGHRRPCRPPFAGLQGMGCESKQRHF